MAWQYHDLFLFTVNLNLDASWQLVLVCQVSIANEEAMKAVRNSGRELNGGHDFKGRRLRVHHHKLEIPVPSLWVKATMYPSSSSALGSELRGTKNGSLPKQPSP